MNLIYYAKGFGYNALPDFFFRRKYFRIKQYEEQCDQKELTDRLNYYFRVEKDFEVPEPAVAIKDFKRTRGTVYYLDMKEFLHYFSSHVQFAYYFGDETHINPYPTLFKARQIGDHNKNSILFKLNKRRHFKWVKDTRSFEQKINKIVWRGGAYHQLRRGFVENFWDHPLCNVGQTNKPTEAMPWQKGYLSISEQLAYKFIFCLEGNDVATNLKWVMSSNSLCFMPKPRFETWFMEGTLRPDIHYVEINNDRDQVEDKVSFYSKNTTAALKIISNAHKHVDRFKNEKLEDLLCLKVLEKYAELSGQSDILKYKSF